MKESAVNPSEGGRLPWEYADGPTVGEDVPITSPPREEEKPGVPKPPPRQPSENAGDGESPPAESREKPSAESREKPPSGDEVREKRAEDPDLSPETKGG